MTNIELYGSVILTGSAVNLKHVAAALPGFNTQHYRANALLVSDVTDPELVELERIAAANDVCIDQVRDRRVIKLAAEETKQPKQPDLKVIAGGWYKTNNDALPLIHVISVRNEVRPGGVQAWLFDIDFVAADALPQPATLSADQLNTYKPKPASLVDFEDLDIIPPSGFEPTPHAIPSVDDTEEEYASKQEELTGVPLPQAQAAVMLLKKTAGFPANDACLARAAGGGFYISAAVEKHRLLPDEIAGTKIRYR